MGNRSRISKYVFCDHDVSLTFDSTNQLWWSCTSPLTTVAILAILTVLTQWYRTWTRPSFGQLWPFSLATLKKFNSKGAQTICFMKMRRSYCINHKYFSGLTFVLTVRLLPLNGGHVDQKSLLFFLSHQLCSCVTIWSRHRLRWCDEPHHSTLSSFLLRRVGSYFCSTWGLRLKVKGGQVPICSSAPYQVVFVATPGLYGWRVLHPFTLQV